MGKAKFSNSTLKGAAQLLMDQGFIDKTALDPKNKHAVGDLLKTCLDSYVGNVTEGYRWLLKEARGRWGAKRAQEFMIDEAALKEWGTPEHMQKIAEAYGGMKEALHYSDETVHSMYELAQDLVERRQWEAAAYILVFLVYVDPYECWFWESLGQCWQATEQWEAAEFAFGTAVNCDPVNTELYRSYCNCLLERGEKKKAHAVLEYGISQLREAPKGRHTTEGIEALESALAYVESLAGKRR